MVRKSLLRTAGRILKSFRLFALPGPVPVFQIPVHDGGAVRHAGDGGVFQLIVGDAGAAGDEDHADLGSPEEPFGTIPVTISPADVPKEPMDLTVKVNYIQKDGTRGIPKNIGKMTLSFTLIIDGKGGVSKSEAVKVTVQGGMKNTEQTVTFDNTLSDLSSNYKVIVEGLPKAVEGKAPVRQRYRLSTHAWVNKKGGITIELIWDDGKYHGPEGPYVYPLPEDEIGAYKQDPFGNKEYLLFHTYDICMQYLGSDELCSGYERCFHKELPYIYDGNKVWGK